MPVANAIDTSTQAYFLWASTDHFHWRTNHDITIAFTTTTVAALRYIFGPYAPPLVGTKLVPVAKYFTTHIACHRLAKSRKFSRTIQILRLENVVTQRVYFLNFIYFFKYLP